MYPFLHRLIYVCDGKLDIFIPKEDYVSETGDNGVYMLCDKCGRKHHLTRVTY
jgi:hypothetical protein